MRGIILDLLGFFLGLGLGISEISLLPLPSKYLDKQRHDFILILLCEYILIKDYGFTTWQSVFGLKKFLILLACWKIKTSEQSQLLDLLSHFLIQDLSLVNANLFLMCMSMIWKMFSLIFLDLHSSEKKWQVGNFLMYTLYICSYTCQLLLANRLDRMS